MKILIPVLHFVPSGGYRVLSNLANEFIKVGHTVDFIVPISSELPYFPTNATIIWVGKGGQYSPVREELESFTRKGFNVTYQYYKVLKKIIKLDSYNVVLANFFLTAYLVYLSKRKGTSGFYYIQAYESDFFAGEKGLRNKILFWLAKFSYRFPLKKIVNSENYKDYKEIRTDRVVFPGLNSTLFTSENRRGFMTDGILRIGTVGRLEKHKGTSDVINAFKKLKSYSLPVELYIAFGTPEMKGDGITIVQPHGDTNLACFYRDIDVYVAAVKVDGPAIHYPVIESMASGTTVISTQLYPVNNLNAYLLTQIDIPNQIVSKVKMLLSDDENIARTSKVTNALESIKKFEWQKVAAEMIDYFKKD